MKKIFIYLLFVIAMITSAFAMDFTRYTLIHNDTFEGRNISEYNVSVGGGGTGVWTIQNSISECYTGSNCLYHAEGNSDRSITIYQNATFFININDNYLIRGWMRNNPVSNAGTGIIYDFRNSSNSKGLGFSIDNGGLNRSLILNITYESGTETTSSHNNTSPAPPIAWKFFEINITNSSNIEFCWFENVSLGLHQCLLTSSPFQSGNGTLGFSATRDSYWDNIELWKLNVEVPPIEEEASLAFGVIQNFTNNQSIFVNFTTIGNYTYTEWYLDGSLNANNSLKSRNFTGLSGSTLYNITIKIAWNVSIFNQTQLLITTSSTCNEDWTANYTTCTIGDNQTLFYTDANTCGTFVDLPGDNGTISACNYCTLSSHTEQTGCVNFEITTFSVYDNFGTCCNVTNLASDCTLPGNTTTGCAGIHEASDTASVVIDFIVEIGISLISYAPIIVLVGGIVIVGLLL